MWLRNFNGRNACTLTSLLLFYCQYLFAQPADTKKKLVTGIHKTMYAKEASLITVTEKTMTSNKYVWIFPSTGQPGHWRRASSEEVQKRLNQEAPYKYKAAWSMDEYQAGMSPRPIVTVGWLEPEISASIPKLKPINFSLIHEDWNTFPQTISNNIFSGTNSRIHVSYAKRIHLNKITLTTGRSYVFVVDSLFVPVANGNNSSLEIKGDHRRPTSIKFIANCITYESPVDVLASGNVHLVFSAKKIVFKSIYDDLMPRKRSSRMPIWGPPIVSTGGSNGVQAFKDKIENDDKKLLNRLDFQIISEGLTELGFVTDEWQKDNLIEKIKVYRDLLSREVIVLDPDYQEKIQKAVEQFNIQYQNHKYKNIRKAGGSTILVSKEQETDEGKLTYHLFPNVARLLPVVKDTANVLLGFIRYKTKDNSELKLIIETQLNSDSKTFGKAQSFLLGKGFNLHEKFPYHQVTINDQPLIQYGKNLGKIIRVGESVIRLEFDLPEAGKTVTELLTKMQTGNLKFNIAYSVPGHGEVLEEISITADVSLMNTVDHQNILSSFDLVEKTELFSELKLVSGFNANRESEGAFDYAEIYLEFQYPDRKIIRGAFRLSSFNTTASELLVSFLKYSPDYKVKVFGTVYYKNGEIQLIPFETKDEIILLNENHFQQ